MSYTSELALALLLIIPLAAAGLIYLVRQMPNVREGVTLVAGVALLINVINLVMVVAAAEVVVGLAIIMTIFRTRRSASVDDASLLKY